MAGLPDAALSDGSEIQTYTIRATKAIDRPALHNADFVWTPELLKEWLANPRTFVPGNRISFPCIITWLMVETGCAAED